VPNPRMYTDFETAQLMAVAHVHRLKTGGCIQVQYRRNSSDSVLVRKSSDPFPYGLAAIR